jgi:cytoskeletal protein RodZ
VSIGESLADARRQAGLTITQVSQRTRIRESIIRAIEQNDFSSCGGDFYARGHIRSIAGVVGADPAPLIREYDAEHGPPAAISAAEAFEATTPIKIRERRRSFGLGKVLILVVLAVIGYAAYYLVSSHSGHDKAGPRVTVSPVVTVTPKVSSRPSLTPTPSPTHKPAKPEAVIVLAATQDCWVSLTTSGGHQDYEGIIPGGHTRKWTEKHLIKMVIGNPSGIHLTVDGKNVTPNTAQVVTVTINPSSKTPVTIG